MKLASKSKTNHASGVAAEELACNFLRDNGFEISALRYKTKHGEIDIIAQKDNLLIFVEVKKRGNFGEDDPISSTQKKRIINAAMQYLSDNPEKNALDMRFDSILIDSTQTLAHIEDAWRVE
jgi:putative endonuclease